MSGAVTATANIDGIVTVDNAISNGNGGASEINVLENGISKLQDLGLGEESVLAPYGTTVEAHAIDSGTVNFSGPDCTGSGATIGPAPPPQGGEARCLLVTPREAQDSRRSSSRPDLHQ
jgi:hypothetical protein